MTPFRRFVLSTLLLAVLSAGAQDPVLPATVPVVAGAEHDASRFHRFLFGRNWRAEWTTPIQAPVVRLDTLYGGLIPYQRSGGGESRSLRLRSRAGKEYVLRSVNKTRSNLLPALLRNSAYGSLVQDGVSMSHPYAALALPAMLTAAGIPHPAPRLVFVPEQPALDTFNAVYANALYLLEERPSGNWSDAPHLGGYRQYLATTDVKEKMRADNRLRADGRAFIRARLFDILISDVDRHEGNWRWGVPDSGAYRFVPVPVDRDQAFFTYNGLLTKLTLALTRRRLMQRFNFGIRNVTTLTSHDQLLDRFFANEMTEADWLEAAAHLERTLTDSVINVSLQAMPAEIVALSGTAICERLVERRARLRSFASRYYDALARKVEIHGSTGAEQFDVRRLPDGTVSVTVHRLDASGQKEGAAFYQRVFRASETGRITLYGAGGNDVFALEKGIRRPKVIVEKGTSKEQYP
ncbi:hypothetical protein [Flaviaesturariibacter amylovorans]|uniref:Uncharacterized protein n=1 Tax=Flaviaesturariibacter amylovorans TaxID=1084520 RepID=A0ABP8GPV1_9BACT